MPNILNHTNYNQLELRKPVLENLSSAPSSPVKGQFYFDTTSNKLGVYNGTTWDYAGGGGVTSVTGTAPIVSSGGSTPAISISPASGSTAGSMSISDFTKLGASTASATASTIVLRDSSGNFAAGTITAALTGTASNAAQLNSQAPSFYTSRANHTGTQTASTISDLTTVVQAYRLDQFAVPTSNLNINSQKLINVLDPTAAQDVATKAYVDGVASGVDTKASVRVTTTTNLTLSAPGAAIDGVTLAVGDRVLVKNQTTASQNGIYVFQGSAAAMTRSTDADTSAKVTSGMYTYVEEGTTNASSGWVLQTSGAIVLATTSLTFTQFSGAGQLTVTAPIVKTGNTLSLNVTTGLSTSGGNLQIDTAVVVRKFAQNIGDGTSTSIAVTHNLGTLDVNWKCWRTTTPFDDVEPDAQRTSTNVTTFIFAVAPTTNQYRVMIEA